MGNRIFSKDNETLSFSSGWKSFPDLLFCLVIPVVALAILMTGVCLSISWIATLGIALLAVMLVVDLGYLAYNKLSCWWDNIGASDGDEEGGDR